ncbi:Uncharacterized conserved protein YegP, UPF0339 family [Halovenus aranensis]|uniref:Uncharacterized conserved protein YegP, UPF0339 family n=1 Tax=Halovenus aranensis TaxID=890420 RepID=A0A1G8RT43_9EURY|nr:YegP family protein [Halovenus aranensis]SDJ20147.1 Uncharacterized conserved protein YegP, UPF0339 family [Halovenus aranensis]
MATTDSNPLVQWYETRVGTSSTADEAVGYWVFVLGVLTGVLGIGLVLVSEVESVEREAGAMLAAVALLLLLIGPVIRLPLQRAATLLSYLGAVLCLLAVSWFVVAYPANFGSQFDGQELQIIGLYGLGVLAIAAGGIFTPMLMSPREEQEAAEARAAEAERERDAAVEEVSQQATEAARQQVEREALETELRRIEDSQSQFELFTDNGGKYRWRLRHRNHNVIADSGQGYSSRQKAQQGLSAVKRDAVGAGVVDLDKADVAVTDPDEGIDGDDAPGFVEAAKSKATFETYEDNEGKYRWLLRHDNGNIIAASGERYTTPGSRDDAVERVRQYVQSADYLKLDPSAFELYRDSAGQYRWRLLHKNGNILADSGQGYTSRQKARNGIDSVQSNVGDDAKASFEVYEDKAASTAGDSATTTATSSPTAVKAMPARAKPRMR